MARNPIYYLSAAQLRAAYASGELTPVQVAQTLLDRINDLNDDLGAFLLVTAQRALGDAAASAERYRHGEPLGPLDGIPIGLKDLIDTADIETTYGSRICIGRIPNRDAYVARALRAAGSVLLGKLALMEFAMGGVTDNITFGYCRNPWRRDHFSGGSSTGSGTAVAAGLAVGALGTDTSGSIRQPASWCGIVGIKPTNGVIDLGGIFQLSPTCDTVGPMTRTVADNAIMFDTLRGQGPLCQRAVEAPDIDGIVLGVPRGWIADGADSEVADAFEVALGVLSSLGAKIESVDLSFGGDESVANTYRGLAYAEAAKAHQAWYPARALDYAPHLRSNIKAGRSVSPADRAAAFTRRAELAAMTADTCQGIAALLTPAMPTTAPALDPQEPIAARRAKSILTQRGRFTMPFSVIGWPALSVPCGFSPSGLPIGLQIAATPLDEAALYRIARAYEALTGWADRHPID